jgi:hypothetical protein
LYVFLGVLPNEKDHDLDDTTPRAKRDFWERSGIGISRYNFYFEKMQWSEVLDTAVNTTVRLGVQEMVRGRWMLEADCCGVAAVSD